MKTNIDKVNCGKYPKPEIWREKEDDGTSGLQVCSLTGKYSCIGCKYYGALLTREEEIVKTADKFAEGYKHDVAASTGFYHGALWADEHPKNQWRDESQELPEYDQLVIGIFKDGSICGCKCSPEERIWFIDMLVSDPPVYWMPIPSLPKRRIEMKSKQQKLFRYGNKR